MGAEIRRVAITDDDAEGYVSAGPELYEPIVGRQDEYDDEGEREDGALVHEVNELLRRGWSVKGIARHLGVSELTVEAADVSSDDDDDFRQTPEEAYGVEVGDE